MNDFYSFSAFEKGDSGLSFRVEFNSDHGIFAGHFPGQPVVPGVCMMQIVKEMMERSLEHRLTLRSTGQVKFLQLITPDLSPLVNLSWKETEAGYMVDASFKLERDVFKMSGVYERKKI